MPTRPRTHSSGIGIVAAFGGAHDAEELQPQRVDRIAQLVRGCREEAVARLDALFDLAADEDVLAMTSTANTTIPSIVPVGSRIAW